MRHHYVMTAAAPSFLRINITFAFVEHLFLTRTEGLRKEALKVVQEGGGGRELLLRL